MAAAETWTLFIEIQIRVGGELAGDLGHRALEWQGWVLIARKILGHFLCSVEAWKALSTEVNRVSTQQREEPGILHSSDRHMSLVHNLVLLPWLN